MNILDLIKMRARLQEMIWDIEAELRHRLEDICLDCTHKTICYDYSFGMYKSDPRDPRVDTCTNFCSKYVKDKEGQYDHCGT